MAATVHPFARDRKTKVYVMLNCLGRRMSCGGQQGIYDHFADVNGHGRRRRYGRPFPATDIGFGKRGNENPRILGDGCTEYIEPHLLSAQIKKCNLQAWYRDDVCRAQTHQEMSGIWVNRIFEHGGTNQERSR